MEPEKVTPRVVVEDFACPKCGEDAWRVDYYNAVHQGARLSLREDGTIAVVEYEGDEESYDDAATENERYVCLACQYAIGEEGSSLKTPPEPTVPEEDACRHCGGTEADVQGCVGCCRDCGRPCGFEKDGEAFHVD